MIPRSAVLSSVLQARRKASTAAAVSVPAASIAVRAFLTKVLAADFAAILRSWFFRDLMTSFLTDLIFGKGSSPPLRGRVYPGFQRKCKVKQKEIRARAS